MQSHAGSLVLFPMHVAERRLETLSIALSYFSQEVKCYIFARNGTYCPYCVFCNICISVAPACLVLGVNEVMV
jgi:hypothetical protein